MPRTLRIAALRHLHRHAPAQLDLVRQEEHARFYERAAEQGRRLDAHLAADELPLFAIGRVEKMSRANSIMNAKQTMTMKKNSGTAVSSAMHSAAASPPSTVAATEPMAAPLPAERSGFIE